MMSLSKNGSHVKLLWSDASFLNAYHLFYHKQFGMLFFIFYFNHLLGNQGIWGMYLNGTRSRHHLCSAHIFFL